jgi:hypothetical protein
MAAPAPATTSTPFRVRAHQIECCNCHQACGCQFGEGPTRGPCEAIIGFEIDDGRFGDVQLDGARFVLAFHYPGAIHLGGGRAVLFVDQRLRPDQIEAIGGILSGQNGGMPWEALANTVASFTGPLPVPLEMAVTGTRSSFRVPGYLEAVFTPIKDLVTGAEKEIRLIYPKGGFFWNEGDICTTSTLWVNHPDLAFRHGNGYACHAEVNWTNQ